MLRFGWKLPGFRSFSQFTTNLSNLLENLLGPLFLIWRVYMKDTEVLRYRFTKALGRKEFENVFLLSKERAIMC